MTLRDLLSTTDMVGLIKADLRGDASGDAILVATYRIGARAKYLPCDYRHGADPEPNVFVVRRPINYADTRKDGFCGLVVKNIPKDLLDLTVLRWDCSDEYNPDRPDPNRLRELSVDLESPELAKIKYYRALREETLAMRAPLPGQIGLDVVIGTG